MLTLAATGQDVTVTLPAGCERIEIRLRGDEDGSLFVLGDGDGHAHRTESGYGNIL